MYTQVYIYRAVSFHHLNKKTLQGRYCKKFVQSNFKKCLEHTYLVLSFLQDRISFLWGKVLVFLNHNISLEDKELYLQHLQHQIEQNLQSYQSSIHIQSHLCILKESQIFHNQLMYFLYPLDTKIHLDKVKYFRLLPHSIHQLN